MRIGCLDDQVLSVLRAKETGLSHLLGPESAGYEEITSRECREPVHSQIDSEIPRRRTSSQSMTKGMAFHEAASRTLGT